MWSEAFYFYVIGRGSGLLTVSVSQGFTAGCFYKKMWSTHSVCPCKSWVLAFKKLQVEWKVNPLLWRHATEFPKLPTFGLTTWPVKKCLLPIADQGAEPNISGSREQAEGPKMLNLSFKYRDSFTMCKQKNPQRPQKWRFPWIFNEVRKARSDNFHCNGNAFCKH